MSRIFAAGLVVMLAAAAVADSPPADQRWMRELLLENPACDPEATRILAAASRQGIEREVHRREDSIRPPTAGAELSCLGDLMQSSQFDIAWPTQQLTADLPGFLQGILMQALGSSGMSFGNIDIQALAGGAADPTRLLSAALCSVAADRWNQATLPVISGFSGLGPFGVLPALTRQPLRRLLAPATSPAQPARPAGRSGFSPSRVLGLGAGQ